MSDKPRKSQDIPPVDTPVVHLDKGEENWTRSLYGLPPIGDDEVPEGEE